MLYDNIQLLEGSEIVNATVDNGTVFPSNPNSGELFYRTDLSALHVYDGSQWVQVGLTSSELNGQPGSYYLDLANHTGVLEINNGGTGAADAPSARVSLGLEIGTDVQAYDADLSAIAGLAGTSGLLRKTNTNTWALDTSSYLTGNQNITLSGDISGSGTTAITATLASVTTAGSVGSSTQIPVITYDAKGRITTASSVAVNNTSTITGDVSGTISSGTGTLTLASVNASVGTWGSSNTVATFTVNNKGLITSATSTAIGLLPASAISSGTFADARIAASNVVQHQSALTILESQITDGSVLARNAGNETITGTWSFSNPVAVGAPTASSHAATKQYVDSTAQGLQSKPAVRVATTANLTATYNNGTSGVGATLTFAGALPSIDGVSLSVGNGVLVKNQTTAAQNGRYNVTQLNPGILTRCGLCDEASEIPGAYVFVQAGTQVSTGWVMSVANPATFAVGTDAISITQFSGAGTYIAGNGLTLTGTTFDVVGTAGRIVSNANNIDLATVGTAGTYYSVTTDAYGRVTSGSSATTGSGSVVLATSPTITSASLSSMTATNTATFNSAINISGNINFDDTGDRRISITGTSDGSDTGRLILASTGSLVTSRGAYIVISGNESTSAGQITLSSGDSGGIVLGGGAVGTSANGSGGLTVSSGPLTVTSGVITGNGSGITTLNASNLSSGTVPDARLSGTYTGVNITGNAGTVTNGVYTTGNQTIDGSKTFSVPILFTNGSFDINGSGPGGQQNGLYVSSLESTVGTTLNPTFTAVIGAQISSSRSIAISVDASGYLYGFRSHSGGTTYTFQSKTRQADELTTARTIALSGAATGTATSFDGSANITIPVTALNASNLSAGTVPSARLSGTYGIDITGNAATVAGYGVSASPTANTLMLRDGNGYSYVNYLNQSSNNSENPTVSQVMVTNGTDNFLRKATVAHVASAMSFSASQITSGTIADARIVGSYTGITNLTMTGLHTVGIGTNGSVRLQAGTAGNSGYIAFHAHTSGTRQGYIGFASSNAANDVGTIPYVAGTHSFTGAITSNSTINAGGAISGTSFAGSGAALTSLNASNLSSGTVPDARISGSYTGLTNLTGSGNVDFSRFLGNGADSVTAPSFSWTGDTNTGIYTPAADQVAITCGGTQRGLFSSSGLTVTGTASATTFSGSGASLTSLNASNLSSGTVPDARISGAYTGITDLTITGNFYPGNDIRFGGTTSVIYNTSTAGYILVSGGSSSSLGANVLLYGEAAGTADTGRLRVDSGTVLQWVTGAVTVTGSITASGDITAFSDERVKKDVEVIDGALDKVKQVRGVTFVRTDEKDGKRHAGVIAQEVEKVLPEVIHENEDGMKSVAYGNMVGLLIEAVKELTAKVEMLEAQLATKE